MNLREGNVFEAMRIVLPEHRAVMGHVSKQRSMRSRPMLTEDQLEEIQYTVGEALDQNLRVKVSLYHPSDDVSLEGTLSVNGRTLLIHTDDEVVQVNIGNIIWVEFV